MADPVGNNPVNNVANFRIDFKGGGDMDIQTLFLALSMERAEYLDLQMKDQAAEMQQKNQVLREATAALTAARAARAKAEKDGGAVEEPAEYKAFYEKYSKQFPDLVKKDMSGNKSTEELKKMFPQEWAAAQKEGQNAYGPYKSGLRDPVTMHIVNNKINDAFNAKMESIKKTNPGAIADNKHSDKEWDVNIESLKGFLDFHNSQSQTDMIKLQSLQNKFNQCFESASNQMSKQAKGLDTIIANLR